MCQVLGSEELNALTKENGLYYIPAGYPGGSVLLKLFYFQLEILSCLHKVTRRP